MASGAKKKAARRKKEKKDSPTNPNPNSDPLPPLHQQGDDLAFTAEEEGVEERFETPRWDPDGSGNVSSPEILRSDRKSAAEGSMTSYGSQTLEAYVNDDVLQVVDDMENGSGEMDEEDRVLDGEGSFVFVENLDDHLVGSDVKETEVKLDEQTVVPDRDSTRFHEVLAENAEVSALELVDASVSLGKEVKVVPWPDEEMPSVEFEAIPNGGDVGLKDLVLEKPPVENSVTESDDGGVNGLPKIEESLEETKSDEPESTFIAEDGSECSKVTVENANSSGEGEVKELIHIDEALEEAKLEKSADVICSSVDNYTLVNEELSQDSKARTVNLDQSSFGVTGTFLEEREVKVLPLPVEVNGEPAPDAAARIEIAPRSEVARAPLVVRPATLWNCCGWLDVLTGSER